MMNYIIIGLAVLGAISVLTFIAFLIYIMADNIKYKKHTKENRLKVIEEDIERYYAYALDLNNTVNRDIKTINKRLDVISKQLENKVDKTEDDITLEEVEKMCIDVDRAVFERLNLK